MMLTANWYQTCKIDSRKIFNLAPLTYIRKALLPLSNLLLFFCVSFIFNLNVHLLMPPDTLFYLKPLLSILSLYPPAPCIVSPFFFICSDPFFSSPLSINSRPRVTAKGNAVQLLMKLTQSQGLALLFYFCSCAPFVSCSNTLLLCVFLTLISLVSLLMHFVVEIKLQPRRTLESFHDKE